jgi:hypothetical protein
MKTELIQSEASRGPVAYRAKVSGNIVFRRNGDRTSYVLWAGDMTVNESSTPFDDLSRNADWTPIYAGDELKLKF